MCLYVCVLVCLVVVWNCLPGCVFPELVGRSGEHPFVSIRDAAAFPVLAFP